MSHYLRDLLWTGREELKETQYDDDPPEDEREDPCTDPRPDPRTHPEYWTE